MLVIIMMITSCRRPLHVCQQQQCRPLNEMQLSMSSVGQGERQWDSGTDRQTANGKGGGKIERKMKWPWLPRTLWRWLWTRALLWHWHVARNVVVLVVLVGLTSDGKLKTIKLSDKQTACTQKATQRQRAREPEQRMEAQKCMHDLHIKRVLILE